MSLATVAEVERPFEAFTKWERKQLMSQRAAQEEPFSRLSGAAGQSTSSAEGLLRTALIPPAK